MDLSLLSFFFFFELWSYIYVVHTLYWVKHNFLLLPSQLHASPAVLALILLPNLREVFRGLVGDPDCCMGEAYYVQLTQQVCSATQLTLDHHQPVSWCIHFPCFSNIFCITCWRRKHNFDSRKEQLGTSTPFYLPPTKTWFCVNNLLLSRFLN